MQINQLTIEKEEVEEENENRFMNQCNVYKREIKEHKKLNDLLEMSVQSLRNIFKNMLEIWVEEGDNEDDLRDNLVLYANICKLTDTEKKRIAVYLATYRDFKKIR